MNHSKILAETIELAMQNATENGFAYNRHIHEDLVKTALDSAYAEGKKDALKKVLESLPEEKLLHFHEYDKGWNAYHLAAREIIKKLIEE